MEALNLFIALAFLVLLSLLLNFLLFIKILYNKEVNKIDSDYYSPSQKQYDYTYTVITKYK